MMLIPRLAVLTAVRMAAMDAVGWLAVPATVMLFVSPFEACFKIYRAKEIGGFAVAPYYAMLVNCSFWMMYAFSKGDEQQVLFVNGIGCCCAVLSISVFLKFSTTKAYLVLAAIVASGVCAAVYWLSIALSARVPQVDTLGAIGIVTSGIMFGGPLAVAADVIKTESVKFLPLMPAVFGFVATSLWTSFAILKGDLFVFLANGPGFLLSTFQISLYWRYAKGSASKPDEKTPLTA
jgi:solute carrier family 50 protein (sugar transporter)